MKLIFTLLLSIFTLSLFSQQVQREKVIVEVGTGTWCSACPAVVQIIHDLQNSGAEIAIVKYHINDSYQNSDGLIRKIYYDFPWYPTTYYDSDHIGYDDWATYNVHESYYTDRINTTSSFSLDLVVDEYDESLIEGIITIDKVDTYAGANLVLHIVLTESHIPENWYGETEVNYVERLMFPDGNGIALDFSGGDQQIIAFNFDIDPSWVFENIEMVYFIQDNDTNEILQGDYINTDDFILGSENHTINTSGIVYPNPARNTISIHSSNQALISNVIIYDIAGRIVIEKDLYNSAINIESLQSGVYFINYLEDNLKRIVRFIKQ